VRQRLVSSGDLIDETHVLCAFATIGALAPVVSHADVTLGNGDFLIISGVGTTGVVGGTPVANGQTTYVGLILTGNSSLTLGTGGTINPTPNEQFGTAVTSSSSGAINITGGTINGGGEGAAIVAQGSGPITVSGGVFNVYAYDAGSMDIDYFGTGNFLISGGTFYDGSGSVGGESNQLLHVAGLEQPSGVVVPTGVETSRSSEPAARSIPASTLDPASRSPFANQFRQIDAQRCKFAQKPGCEFYWCPAGSILVK
jgi:hypothetical protein